MLSSRSLGNWEEKPDTPVHNRKKILLSTWKGKGIAYCSWFLKHRFLDKRECCFPVAVTVVDGSSPKSNTITFELQITESS